MKQNPYYTGSRKHIYNKWKEASESKELAEIESAKLTKIGNEVFCNKYNNSFENYDEVNGDPELDDPWMQADVEYDKIVKNQLLVDGYYKQLLASCPENFLEQYESSACAGHETKKLVKIKFFDGEEKIGYIYPWESDYSGPPYHIDELYLNNGEWIESIEYVNEFNS